MKVLVCGGRTYDDAGALGAALSRVHNGQYITHLIHGGAHGADRLAGAWAREQYGMQEVICPANWWHHGKAAGAMRNKAMLALQPDLVLAFPGGRGTQHMVDTARAAGIPVFIEPLRAGEDALEADQ